MSQPISDGAPRVVETEAFIMLGSPIRILGASGDVNQRNADIAGSSSGQIVPKTVIRDVNCLRHVLLARAFVYTFYEIIGVITK